MCKLFTNVARHKLSAIWLYIRWYIVDTYYYLFFSELPASSETKKDINIPSLFEIYWNERGAVKCCCLCGSMRKYDNVLLDCVSFSLCYSDRYSVNFIPRETGTHLVHVRLNGVHVPGSPYQVQVGQFDADASRVRAYGDGLYKGFTGKKWLNHWLDCEQAWMYIIALKKLTLSVT